MWESICLTLVATAGNNIGKVLQKKGTVILPPLSFKFKVVRAYVFNKAWVIGFLMDIFGALLMLKALSQSPVSVIQPVSGCGLAILCIFSHFYLKEVMNVVDWVGIAFTGVGTIGVGAGGEEQESSAISIFHLPLMVFVVAFLFVLLNGWLHFYKRQRRKQELDGICNIQDGICIFRAGFLQDVGSCMHFYQYMLQCYRICFPDSRFKTWESDYCVHMCCCGINFDWCTCWHACSGRTIAFCTSSSSFTLTWMAAYHCWCCSSCELNAVGATSSAIIATFHTDQF
ncbi:probable magnesium transporter NIPA9 isoform X2 [Telopea speciosissima]|uniref:probable magnesium transporter NIPA9 isoform X2 n=1 Tax=Telopea speciosissima TaxID=54955 RepID=UPI001CC700A1|nr:probable magnesium transporter NIPA9 isoform X2 [Telopea speciosissima]